MEKVEISAIYRDTQPIITSRLEVSGDKVVMSRSTYRRYCNSLCYSGTDGIRARSCLDGRRLIIYVDFDGLVPVSF